MSANKQKKPPVVILGGSSNALSIARSLGKQGVDVYLSVLNKNCASYTRYAKKVFPIVDKKEAGEFWAELMLGKQGSFLHGSVVFPCNDDGIEFVAKYRDQLKNNYILDDSIPELQLTLLNKRKTLELTESIGLPIPKYVAVESAADMDKIDADIQFPVIVKPQHSHLFQKAFSGTKLFFVNNPDELKMRLKQVLDFDLKVIVNEFIPGPDTLLGSYYTYIDSNDNILFHFTKKVVRRFPKNNGQACYHVTEWIPDIAEIGLKFFKGINFRGLGNVEFKRDLRDGKLKIIESNARFTAAQELLAGCGMDISIVIYNHLAGLPVPQLNSYKEGLTLWFPHQDYLAYKELKKLNEITFGKWARSIARRHVMPHFKLSDPLPTIIPFLSSLKNKVF